MSPRLIQLSGVVVDLTYRVAALPVSGSEAIVNGFAVTVGGGFNAMVAAQRLGLDVAYGGTPGTGPFADYTRAALDRMAIPVLRPPLEGADQGVCTVLVEPSGERSFVAAEGADGILSRGDLESLPLRPDDWLLLSGYTLAYRRSRAALTHWLQGPGRGRRLVFDPAPLVAQLPPESLRAALSAALWVSANRAEAQAITGEADPAVATRSLAAGRAGGAVVRVGAEGCWIAGPEGPAQHLPGHPARTVDTTGAGDTHVGAFMALMATGMPPARAAALANVAAAISTETEGPATAPDLPTVLRAAGMRPAT